MKLFLLTFLCWHAAAETKAEKDLREQLAVAQREKAALIAALARASVGGAATSTKVESGAKAAATGRKEATATAVTIAESAQLTADANAEIARQTATTAAAERDSARLQTEQLQRTSDKSISALAWGFYTLAFGVVSNFLIQMYTRRANRVDAERKEDRAEAHRLELATQLKELDAGQKQIHTIVNSTLTAAKQVAVDALRNSLELWEKDTSLSVEISSKIAATKIKITELQEWLDHQAIQTEEAEKQLKVDLASL